jgi:NitT/TauT family transport system substrate-binding protein
VIQESGSWEKHGLQVEYDYFISAEDAHKNVANGSVEFVGGNHVSTYGKRATGDRWVYIAQSVGLLNHRMVVRPDSGITKVSDLKGKVIGSRGQHPGLNTWLYLRQNGLEGSVEVVRARGEGESLWEWVRDKKVDAAFVTPPADLFARRAGLKTVNVEFLPMVWFTTVSTGLPFLEQHPDIVERFLKAFCEGIAYFKTHRQESVKIIKEKYKEEGELDDEAAAYLHQDIANILLAKPYATIQSIANVYELGKKQDPAAEKIEPMALWNFHHLRRIDDSGFIDNLYRL